MLEDTLYIGKPSSLFIARYAQVYVQRSDAKVQFCEVPLPRNCHAWALVSHDASLNVREASKTATEKFMHFIDVLPTTSST
jgi:hypothetical protein